MAKVPNQQVLEVGFECRQSPYRLLMPKEMLTPSERRTFLRTTASWKARFLADIRLFWTETGKLMSQVCWVSWSCEILRMSCEHPADL